MSSRADADDASAGPSEHDRPAEVQPGIPPGRIALLNGYDRGYPHDGLVTPIDPAAKPVLREAVASADPKFAAQGWMSFGGGTWKVEAPGALGDMIFPRQGPLRDANLDSAIRYRASGAIDTSVHPPVMDVQMIENPPPRRRQWIVD